VLLTGGSGFIGAYVVRALVARGVRPRVLALPETVTTVPCRESVEIVAGSLTDPVSLPRAVRDVDVVLHVGGSNLGSKRPDLIAVNVHGTGHLLRASAAAAVRRFVYVSSAAVYDRAHFLPALWPIDEDFPLAPHGVPALHDYGFSKVEAEKLVHRYGEDGRDYVIVRPTVTYGPGAGFIERLLEQLRAHPERTRTPSARVPSLQWIHARDLASLIVAAVDTPGAARATLTAAGRELFSMHTVAGIAEALRRNDERQLRQARLGVITGRVRYSVDRAARLVSWSPTLDLVEGLREMVIAARMPGVASRADGVPA
jgi:nucleoside-diphosphate-sugar epimerase